ncbi:hypothetical protein Pmani_015248 [Petrolisthes manimaculis]|nr:hypothetical protein Pmani_031517 [Petrolisthes manimaculis]KAK4313406.1 hypothetical protein Pmani_015248 [Petrolisthes manimaculis]
MKQHGHIDPPRQQYSEQPQASCDDMALASGMNVIYNLEQSQDGQGIDFIGPDATVTESSKSVEGFSDSLNYLEVDVCVKDEVLQIADDN